MRRRQRLASLIVRVACRVANFVDPKEAPPIMKVQNTGSKLIFSDNFPVHAHRLVVTRKSGQKLQVRDAIQGLFYSERVKEDEADDFLFEPTDYADDGRAVLNDVEESE